MIRNGATYVCKPWYDRDTHVHYYTAARREDLAAACLYGKECQQNTYIKFFQDLHANAMRIVECVACNVCSIIVSTSSGNRHVAFCRLSNRASPELFVAGVASKGS